MNRSEEKRLDKLVKEMNEQISEGIASDSNMDDKSWNYQDGILIFYNDAILLTHAVKELRPLTLA